MKAERFYQFVLAGIAALALVLQIAALGPWRSQLWGFHLLDFLPLPLAVGSWLLTLAAIAWLLLPARFARLEAAIAKLARLPPRLVPLVLVPACAGAFWFLRSGQTVLGDAWVLVSDLPKGLASHPRQPLTMYLQQQLYRGVGAFSASRTGDGTDVAMTAVAIGSVAAGVLFVLVAWGLGRTLSKATEERAPATTTTALLVCSILLSQGYCQLFYGYLENYAPYALFTALYLLCSLQYLRGRLPLLVPFLVLLCTVGLHLSAVVFLPTLLLLVGLGLARAGTRRAAARDLALGVVAVLLLDRIMTAMPAGLPLRRAVAGIVGTATSDQGGGAGLGYMFSAAHGRDFVNEQFLIGPLGSWLFLPALVYSWLRRDIGTATGVFLTLAAAVLLGASWFASEPALGYARDWDIFAAVGVVFTVAGLHLLVTGVRSSQARARLLSCGLLLSCLHLGAWVLVNHSEARSMARFVHLPLGQGRTEVVVGNWHLRHGRSGEAVAWFEKALQVNPGNGTAYALLGYVYGEQGQMERAAAAFLEACRLRPDKPEHRHNLVKALVLLGRYQETLPHYEMLCRAEPELVDNWLEYSQALRALGRETEARALLERALGRFDARLQRQPRDSHVHIDVGVLLASLERYEQALGVFQQALGLQPDSDTALYDVGSMLMRLGRGAEARPYLQRLLQVNPQHSRQDEVRNWLTEIGGR